jgi:hypothetical protein
MISDRTRVEDAYSMLDKIRVYQLSDIFGRWKIF